MLGSTKSWISGVLLQKLKPYLSGIFIICVISLMTQLTEAQDIVNDPHILTPLAENNYIFNTFVLLFCAALVMWMATGFCMLEAGSINPKSTASICLKNITLYSIACLVFYILGYNLMFLDVDSFWGSISFFTDMDFKESSILKDNKEHLLAVISQNSSQMATVFFQTTLVAVAASITSGALAERVKLWPFFCFIIFLAGVIYPIQGSWSWGGGWLADMGFVDFAGSTVVHSVGGWAALTGAIFLGPRQGKYQNGTVKIYFPTSVPLIFLGTFILWFGWLGFNSGSLLVTSGVTEISKMALIFMNTNIAAASGVVTALLVSLLLTERINILLVLQGALAGLVSITAGPDFAQPFYAIFIGGVGSCLAIFSYTLLDKYHIDDVVGAIPIHLVAGIWGTLAVGIWGPASFKVQLIGVLSVGAFTVITTSFLWFALKKFFGIRVLEDVESLGQDLMDLGLDEPESLIDSMISDHDQETKKD